MPTSSHAALLAAGQWALDLERLRTLALASVVAAARVVPSVRKTAIRIITVRMITVRIAVRIAVGVAVSRP
jgi:hypothetical protein